MTNFCRKWPYKQKLSSIVIRDSRFVNEFHILKATCKFCTRLSTFVMTFPFFSLLLWYNHLMAEYFFAQKPDVSYGLSNFVSHNSRLLLFLFQPAVCALFCLLVTFWEVLRWGWCLWLQPLGIPASPPGLLHNKSRTLHTDFFRSVSFYGRNWYGSSSALRLPASVHQSFFLSAGSCV